MVKKINKINKINIKKLANNIETFIAIRRIIRTKGVEKVNL